MFTIDKTVLLLFILTAFQIVFSTAPHKLQLSVYYESNCPDSKKFILEQLQPTMQLLHHYVSLKFIPFGKSRSLNYGDDGFECQHGQSECLGNMVQDCSLYHMKHFTDLDQLRYVACEMAKNAGSEGNLQCVRKANLSEQQIEDCVLKERGIILQLESEHFTSLVQPSWVPTVTINGIFDQEVQDNAQTDLFGTLCSFLPDAAPCARHYNAQALGSIMNIPARPQNLI